ncbi:SpaA isopeptide-forming pilin-related protein [Schaalia sp. ZJ1691]|uniref:SpaA isopeptide-forming pilin-related protein n=1 Tax=Schaalia sp. ZJ1691 TaxID=2709404 RepID=UPI0013ED8B0D|nr:SpaA isopeptide-forming pilin-related protein [Schaalia sp. ZJ1691]
MRESKVKMAAVFAATCALSLVHLAPAIAQTDQGETWDEGTTAVAGEGAAAVSETETPESGDVVNVPAEDTPRFGSDRSAAGAAEAPVGSDRSATGAEVSPAGTNRSARTQHDLDPLASNYPLSTRITSIDGGRRTRISDEWGSCEIDKAVAANPDAHGIVILTSTGELYRIKPGTEKCNIADQMEPLPFLPVEYKQGIRTKDAEQNFNALGTAPDGTMYVIERSVKDLRDDGMGVSNRQSTYVVVQVWKLAPGSREWTRFGSRYVVTGQGSDNHLWKLEILGGAVDPVSGNYFFGGFGLRKINPKGGEGRANLQGVYYLFEADRNTREITARGWVPLVDQGISPGDVNLSPNPTRNADVIFTTAGDLLIGFGNKREVYNKLDVISVPSSQLRRGVSSDTKMQTSGRTSFDLAPFADSRRFIFSEITDCQIPDATTATDGRRGCPFPALFAANGFDVSPNGSLLISVNMTHTEVQYKPSGVLYEITPGVTTPDGTPPKKIQEIPEHPPVESVSWFRSPGLNWHVFKEGMKELWDFPVSARLPGHAPNPGFIVPGTRERRYVSGLWNSNTVDMDGRSEPFASITVKKDIPRRKNPDDQFTVSASKEFTGWNFQGNFTTTGNAEGVQAGQIGPMPIPAGETVKLTEQIAQGQTKDLKKDYQPELRCVDGGGHDVSETVVSEFTADERQASADVTIPAAGGAAAQLTCTFVNDSGAKLGSIAVSKQDADGHKPLAGATFTLCADKDGNGAYSEDDCAADGNGEDRVTNGDGLAEWKEKAFGTYFLVEKKAPEGYTITKTAKSLPTEYPQAVDANGKAVEGVYKVVLSADTLNASGTMTGVVLNERIPGTVTWTKVDAADTGQALGGSEWTLTGPDGRSVTITDCATGTGMTCRAPGAGSFVDTDPKKGSFKLTKLPWGRYTLKESKAPAGYALSSATYPVEIDKELVIGDHHGVRDLGQIKNAKAKLPILPFTGGMSADIFRLSALGVFGLTALSALCLRRRKVVRSSSTQS